MRDLNSRTATYCYSRTTKYGSRQYCREAYASSSGRANLKHSDHFRPTYYGAFRMRTQTNNFELHHPAGYTMSGKRGMGRTLSTDGLAYAGLSTFSANSGRLPDFPHSEWNAAGQAAISAIGETSVNLANNAGEIRQTAGMLRERAMKLVHFLRALALGQYRRAALLIGLNRMPSSARSKTLANLWLEYSFGWKPLITDILGAHEAVLKALEKKSRGEQTFSSIYKVPYSFPWSTVYDYAGSVNQSILTQISYKYVNDGLFGKNTLGLTNPLSLAWELMPYSFVVDWLVNVSSFLQNLTVPHALAFGAGFQTAISEGNYTVTEVGFAPTYSGSRPSWTVQNFAMERRILGDFPVPHSPIIKLDYNFTKMIHTLALLVQRQKR